MTISAKAAGAAGIVLDGSCMNSALLVRERPQIPIFSRGVSAVARGSEGPGSINVPAICGGVIVYPGDIVLADSDGVVVLRPDVAKAIVDKARSHDAKSRQANDAGVPYYEQRGSEAKLRALDVDFYFETIANAESRRMRGPQRQRWRHQSMGPVIASSTASILARSFTHLNSE